MGILSIFLSRQKIFNWNNNPRYGAVSGLSEPSRKTILYDRHVALNAKMVEFCGWEMPIQYKGIIQEHKIVRESCGIFDVSHMGRIIIEGPDAERFVDLLSTNKIWGKPDSSAIYTVWSLPFGGTLDDVIVYKKNPQHFFVIVNAANRQKDLKYVLEQSERYDVVVSDCYETEGILAIQGAKAVEIVSEIFPAAKSLPRMHFIHEKFEGKDLILSNTGYTGSKGFEIYAPNDLIVLLWDAFLQKGVEPIGLGARDTLRLEMGYALYGHELSETISANESVSAWAVKWDKGEFIGKSALQKIEKDKRFEYGILLEEAGIAREGAQVFLEGKNIGKVTSGTHSPTLNRAIAIIISDVMLKAGDKIEVQIRKNLVRAQVAALPFIKQ